MKEYNQKSERSFDNQASSRNDSSRNRGDRHNFRHDKPKSNMLNFYSGQVFGLIYNMSVLALVYSLIEKEEKTLALEIFGIHALIVIAALILGGFRRRFSSQRPHKKFSRDRRKGRGERDRDNSRDRDYSTNR